MLTPGQVAAAHGWGRWPKSRAASEEEARIDQESEGIPEWFFSDQVSPDNRRAVFAGDALIARDKDGNFTIVVKGEQPRAN